MADHTIIRAPRLTDGQILDLLDAFSEQFAVSAAKGRLGKGVFIDLMEMEQRQDLARDGHALQSADFNSERIIVSCRRGTALSADDIDSRQASAFYDEVAIGAYSRSREAPGPSAEEIIKCVTLVEKNLPAVYPAGKDQSESLVEVIRTEIAQLAGTYRELFAGLEQQRQRNEEELSAERNRIAEERHEALTAHAARVVADDEKLAKQARELDARETELDNKSHMHERRRLRTGIINDLKDRTKVSRVSKSGRYIQILVIVLSLGAVAYLGQKAFENFNSAYAIENVVVEILKQRPTGAISEAAQQAAWKLLSLTEGTTFWTHIGQGVLFSSGAAFFLLYALSWMRRIYAEDVEYRANVERFQFDIDRASWVIESVMEMDDKQKATLPNEWMEGVCRNLFNSAASESSKSGSANALADLLYSMARVKISSNGAEFDIDKSGARRLAKDIEKGD